MGKLCIKIHVDELSENINFGRQTIDSLQRALFIGYDKEVDKNRKEVIK